MSQALTPALTALIALAVVLALVWVAARAARFAGFARARRSGQLAVEDQIALDPRRRLMLVKCADRRVLLLTGGANDIVVGWIADE